MKSIVVCFLIPFLFLGGCASQGTPAEMHNAAVIKSEAQERSAKLKRQSLDERLARLKIGMPEGMAISAMGVAPVRLTQLRTAAGDEHVLVYAQSQFWTIGQAMLQGMARQASANIARDGFVILRCQNRVLASVERSDY